MKVKQIRKMADQLTKALAQLLTLSTKVEEVANTIYEVTGNIVTRVTRLKKHVTEAALELQNARSPV